MSTAAAMKPCACGCGNPVIGRKFLNARHKQRAAPPAPKTYPHYISAELREVLCAHGNVVTEWAKHWRGMASAATDWITLIGCPECKSEEQAKLDALKPKPSSNPCENRTCSCVAPKCPDCGHPMKMGPGCLGWHSWVCCDAGLAEDTKAEGGIIAKPFVPVGTHRAERWTGWRN